MKSTDQPLTSFPTIYNSDGNRIFYSYYEKLGIRRFISILFFICWGGFSLLIFVFGPLIAWDDDISNKYFFVFIYLVMTIILYGSIKSLYLLIKGETPESLILRESSLIFNSGRPNIKIGFFLSFLSELGEFKRLLLYKVQHHHFSCDQLKTLTLRETDHGNRITIDQGRHRISFFTTATDEQRKWLFNYLNSYYDLKLEEE